LRHLPQSTASAANWPEYAYDPQGTLSARAQYPSSATESHGEPFTDVPLFDSYGTSINDAWASFSGNTQYVPFDPAGFGSQWGYYGDHELATRPSAGITLQPYLLTTRYYDPSMGRFVNRDTAGYGGGPNLYAFCGGNLVNRKVPVRTYRLVSVVDCSNVKQMHNWPLDIKPDQQGLNVP
jgi:RHS repeat-associated protein